MIFKLLKFELLIYNRSYHIIQNNIYMLLLSSIVFSMILPEQFLSNHVKMLMCFFGVIFASLSIPHYLVKIDAQDGSLETLISTISPIKIFAAKYLALTISLIISAAISMCFICMFFSFSSQSIIFLSLLMILVIFQMAALIMLGNIVHAYFRRNTNFLISLILPLIIPTLIIGRAALETLNFDFIMILLGINMVIVPIIFFVSSYLLANLYDF
jgi:heme exporter protein B